jgi:pimeloyl-ACP methyl ester carboxylesterase
LLTSIKIRTMLINLLVVGAGVFFVLCALLYWRQDNLIFFPRPNDALLLQKQQANRVEIRASGAVLEGWWVENLNAASQAVILYFGGNGEDVLYTATTAPLFDARRMLVVNYRGYGRSAGKPSQKALYDDALAIYEYAIGSGVRAEQIVVMGRSLGSGMAAMLAGSRPVGAAILITPYDSVAAVAARHYSFFPVRLLLRHPFPSLGWAKQAKAPALIIAGERDTLIPPLHAQRLYDAWAGTKQIHVLAGSGHGDIELHPDYYRLINEFLGTARPALTHHHA